MKRGNSATAHYTPLARAFHWITAILFIIQFPIGYTIAFGTEEKSGAALLNTHMITGLIIFWVVVFRAAYRLYAGAPRMQATLAPWHKPASYMAHALLYLLLLSVPIMGWLGSDAAGGSKILGLFALPAALAPAKAKAALILYWHGVMAFALLGGVFIHIAIAMQGYLEKSEPDKSLDKDEIQGPALPAPQ